jgi:hypothetical protein
MLSTLCCRKRETANLNGKGCLESLACSRCASHDIFLLKIETHDVHSQHTYSTFTAMIC